MQHTPRLQGQHNKTFWSAAGHQPTVNLPFPHQSLLAALRYEGTILYEVYSDSTTDSGL